MTKPIEEVLGERLANLDMAIKANEFFAGRADSFQSEVLLEMRYESMNRERTYVVALKAVLAMPKLPDGHIDGEDYDYGIRYGYNQCLIELHALIEGEL